MNGKHGTLKAILMITALWPLLAGAWGGGMGSWGSGGMMAGGGGMAGMTPVVAADGSVIVIEGMAGGMWRWDGQGALPAVVNIDSAGTERWRVEFEEARPMMVTTEAGLVLVSLTDTAHRDGGGMGGGDHGGGGQSDGGGHGGGHMMSVGDAGWSTSLLALDLATGVELWRLELDGSMVTAEISGDGSLVYAVAHGTGMPEDGESMHQGDRAGGMGGSTLYAIDALSGSILWVKELSTTGDDGDTR